MKPKLYYLGKPEDGFGWGVANTNLVRALGEFCEVVVDERQTKFDGPVFVPVRNEKLEPLRKVRAPRVIGYCFTEWPLSFDAHRNARQYDVLFAGSNWNVQRLAEQGIKAEVLHQGIDFDRFTVQPFPSFQSGDKTKFVVFSGGKFEFRKGQDYVITALRHFMHVHSDVVLLAAWHNPWPATMETMRHSWLLDDWRKWKEELGNDRVVELPPMRNEQTPAIYAQAHIGLFPNRCEAGTNLVMCEFMASGRPVIASNATGQADVLGVGAYPLSYGSYDAAGWFNPHVSDIIAWLEWAYKNREELPQRGLQCRELVERFTWRSCAEKIFSAAFPELAARESQSQVRAIQQPRGQS